MTGGVDLLFDVLLCVALVWLAWRTVTTLAVFGSVVLFMVLGLFLALVRARLDAPDVALAEAVLVRLGPALMILLSGLTVLAALGWAA